MITLGCDVGSLFTKAVLMDGDRVLASSIVRTTGNVATEVGGLMEEVRKKAGAKKIDRTCATGTGADLVRGADIIEDDVSCVGAAGAYYLEDVELVIEMGGQSITSILLDEDGDVENYMRNDKCASGSGRFMEVMAVKLGLDISDIDREVENSKRAVELSAQCGVFAESEVITHVNAGEARPDVMAGVCASVARIVSAQGRRFKNARYYTLTGGVAKTGAVTSIIKERLSGEFQAFPFDPQLAAAIGAALLAGLD